ncbi:hypothetical protein DFH09DRAFT_1307545 [Mycena vulgaris]|nr:hypothetical protein DFH09DRAFT_1307545 [Mycena vulgaris]
MATSPAPLRFPPTAFFSAAFPFLSRACSSAFSFANHFTLSNQIKIHNSGAEDHVQRAHTFQHLPQNPINVADRVFSSLPQRDVSVGSHGVSPPQQAPDHQQHPVTAVRLGDLLPRLPAQCLQSSPDTLLIHAPRGLHKFPPCPPSLRHRTIYLPRPNLRNRGVET